MAIFPFILLKSERLKSDPEMINHETIHLRQQLELLILPFYLLYLFNYLINLFKYRNHHQAYRNIIFEKEAYHHDTNLNYLKNGNWYGWIRSI
ncbi:hypothetical protein H9L23_21820 [Pedobacter roseus]|uniref:DUF4157 domain-containing protein n=2 Tax=Pedobacter roseus TaxID=336820 RepID=A0A7G9QP78_9SPHI|nr:hypothetical protein H9L23_21820 [Pedobacter roseus]